MRFEEIRNAKVVLIIKNKFNKVISREEASIEKLLWLTNLKYASAKKLYEYQVREIEHVVWEYGVEDDRYLTYTFDEFKEMMKKEKNVEIENEDDDIFYDEGWLDEFELFEDEFNDTYINISKTEDVHVLINQINTILKLNRKVNFNVTLK